LFKHKRSFFKNLYLTFNSENLSGIQKITGLCERSFNGNKKNDQNLNCGT
jgi:hypothetical protein